VDVYVNHKLVARGEVVVAEEDFGIRIKEIVSKP
jgi:flagellar motor switch protein FliN/FliY